MESLSEFDQLRASFLVNYLEMTQEDAFKNYQFVIFHEGMSLEDLARKIVDDGHLGEISEALKHYVNYTAIAYDLIRDGYHATSKGVFQYSIDSKNIGWA